MAVPLTGEPRPRALPQQLQLSPYLGQVPNHRLHEAQVSLAGYDRAKLQAQEGMGWQVLQEPGEGSGAQGIERQGQGPQALCTCTEPEPVKA